MKDLRMKIFWKSKLMYSFILFLLILSCTTGWTQANKYHAYSDIEAKLKQLSDDYSNVIRLESHGETLGGKEIWSVTLDPEKSDSKPSQGMGSL